MLANISGLNLLKSPPHAAAGAKTAAKITTKAKTRIPHIFYSIFEKRSETTATCNPNILKLIKTDHESNIHKILIKNNVKSGI